jgi:hypothetical protein
MVMLRRQSLITASILASIFYIKPAFSYSLDFVMVNNTNQSIVTFMEITASIVGGKYNIFDNTFVRANGGSQRFNFNRTAVGEECYVDMKIKFSGEEYVRLDHVNLCSVRTITINAYNGNVTYVADAN